MYHPLAKLGNIQQNYFFLFYLLLDAVDLPLLCLNREDLFNESSSDFTSNVRQIWIKNLDQFA